MTLCTVLLFGLPTAQAANDAQENAADALYQLNLFSGVGKNKDGTPNYDLDRAPTRSEAVTMLVRLLGKEAEATQGNWETPFTDVVDWAKPYVGYAYNHKLTMGTSATTFGGNGLVTATQYLTFVLRALGYDSSTDFKWDAAWELSDSLRITAGEYKKGSQFMRGDVAKVSYHALDKSLKGSDKTLVDRLKADHVVDPNAVIREDIDAFIRVTGRNVDTFVYADTTIPVATGFPRLTDAEIDQLVASKDYAYIADKLSTLADCVNYFYRADFRSKDSDYFSGDWSTHICGQQVIARRGASCGGMCNALAYLLKGDYEELGYFDIDGHIMNYLKIDGLYYVINSVDYARGEDGFWQQRWHESVDGGVPHRASDLKTIAEGWIKRGVTKNRCYTYVSPGDMFPQSGDLRNPKGLSFPVGTEVKDWIRDDVSYRELEEARNEGPEEYRTHRVIDWTTGTDWVDEGDITHIED